MVKHMKGSVHVFYAGFAVAQLAASAQMPKGIGLFGDVGCKRIAVMICPAVDTYTASPSLLRPAGKLDLLSRLIWLLNASASVSPPSSVVADADVAFLLLPFQ